MAFEHEFGGRISTRDQRPAGEVKSARTYVRPHRYAIPSASWIASQSCEKRSKRSGKRSCDGQIQGVLNPREASGRRAVLIDKDASVLVRASEDHWTPRSRARLRRRDWTRKRRPLTVCSRGCRSLIHRNAKSQSDGQ